ncbi:MAG TPA: amidase family protein [Actinophytocola sp.]|uniref:amidase family protein n=1 Tax=Actinophytocola sp. TaxID=1872138 RepID=UPI002DB9B61A|nr:amidase family protein [Actinophytocola sp.]HEU5473994.1 amidase family protein [Actinophytocola sp.]
MDIDELLWAGADAQAAALRDGSASAVELTEAVLRRIDAVDPTLNAFRTVYGDAARAAAAAAQRRIDAGERTPLLGVPVAIKDDLDVAGDFTGKGGRPQFPPAERDGPVVARLRAAGAVVIGHTRTPDRCLWPFTETLAYGATRNPWQLDHTPGGSSGGSAAAIAAGIVGVATGSDGGGSVRIPSGACGVFGMKTSRGLIDDGAGQDWHGLSVIGPLGRRVADAAALLDVIAGGPVDPAGGYRAAVDADPGPLRVALSWWTPLGKPPRIEAARRQAVLDTADRLRALGHHVEPADPPLGPRPSPQFLVRYLRGVADDVAGLPHPEWLEPRTRRIARLGGTIPDRVLARARAAEAGLHKRMSAFFGDFDVLLQPGWTTRQPRVGRYHGSGTTSTLAGVSLGIPYFPTWNVLGYPVAALPVGWDDAGLPIGVQLIGPADAERRLLSLSGQYERAHPWADRRPDPVYG